MTTLFAGSTSILSRTLLTALAFAFALALVPAQADEQVGVAVTVRNDVTGKLQSNVVRVNDGSNVYGREIVKTAPDASAKLVLKDNTNLNVGPNSSVSLDNFVFAGNSDYKQAGFNLAKGAFRFTSGASDKRAYDLKTPVATIGVRGTDIVMVVGQKTLHQEVRDGKTLTCAVKATQESKACTKEELAETKKDRKRKCCSCAYVSEGEAVDVTEFCVAEGQFQGLNVGENPVSFAEATGPGIGVGAVGVALGAAGIVAGVVAGNGGGGSNNSNNNPPIGFSR